MSIQDHAKRLGILTLFEEMKKNSENGHVIILTQMTFLVPITASSLERLSRHQELLEVLEAKMFCHRKGLLFTGFLFSPGIPSIAWIVNRKGGSHL